MDKKYIQESVTKLRPWYQTINFDGIINTKGGPYRDVEAGERGWGNFSKLIPNSLEGMRVLDLGCNAGYFSVMSSLMGATKVIGIESNKTFFNQTKFVKEYFEFKHGKKFNDIEFIHKDISDVNLKEIGPFDYVYALAILYHIGKHKYGKMTPKAKEAQELVVATLSEFTKNFIVRSRNGKDRDINHYNFLFKKYGFKLIKVISEGKRDLILYSK